MILRNLAPAPVAIDVPALGTSTHQGGVSSLDPQTGARALRLHTRDLPKSLSLAACVDRRRSLADAVADGSAVAGLPDAIAADPAVAGRLAARTMSVHQEATQ